MAQVAKTRAHHLGGNAEFFIVVVDLANRLHARVCRAGVIGLNPGRTGGLFVPVVNTAYKGRNQLYPGLAAGHRLAKREQQRQVGVNAQALQLLGRRNPLPGGRHLDQHPVAVDALGPVKRDQALRPRQAGCGVKAQPGVDLSGHPPRNDGQNLAAKAHQQPIHLLIERAPSKARHGVFEQRHVIRFLHRLENQRWVGGGVAWLISRHLLEVAGVGHHRGVLLECVELVHGYFLAVNFCGAFFLSHP